VTTKGSDEFTNHGLFVSAAGFNFLKLNN